MKLFNLELRFLTPLVITLVAAAYLAVPLMDQLTLRWFSRDLNTRGSLLTNTLSETITEAVDQGKMARLKAPFERAVQDERVLAIALCGVASKPLLRTASFPDALDCDQAKAKALGQDARLALAGGAVHIGVHMVNRTMPSGDDATDKNAEKNAEKNADKSPQTDAIKRPVAPDTWLVLLHDMSFIDRRSQDTRQYTILFIAALGLIIALITVAVAHLSWRGWVKGVQGLLRGEGLFLPWKSDAEISPIAAELRARLRDLDDEYRRALGHHTEWTAERLRSLLRSQLRGDQVIVVSNREPYIHELQDRQVNVKRPASGLVTAVEPVMRACSGTWIAHGSGSADRQVVDHRDRVGVPPGKSDYMLRRIWLTTEEEQGYYFGLANEGLWPLCHVAHVRPVFRESDWQHYRTVNQRFADAVVAEARSDDPIVLVQDYHFALLPAMIRAKLPKATILSFWHIPWPNPESFGICPWRREILEGMLGSTIIGFHTRFHCKNFIETVDRFLEARIEHEHATIAFQDKETLVESYPISIAWPTEKEVAAWPSVAECRRAVFERLQLPADTCLAVGVDRFDYTKGILERIHAVERLLEKRPEWIGRFIFVQVAAPTRSALEEYRAFQDRIERVTLRVNQRFGRPGYQPVHLLAQHHEQDAVTELFRAADVCVVTSLHDGMNLVCKEFVAARDDERGVLVLSRFAGAAREMSEALLVNPYHVEETADALHQAATMPLAEQRERMGSMRMTVREYNVFRWAGNMLADAGRFRLRERIEARVQRHHES